MSNIPNNIKKMWEEAAKDKEAANKLNNIDRRMADIMPGVKAKNRPNMPKDLSAEALRLQAQKDLEK